jgi:Zn-dependent peptidase ImmA (M78 family)
MQKKAMSYSIMGKIEAIAENVLKKTGIHGIPVPVEEMADKLGIKISRAPSSDFSGLLIRKDGRALIGVNSNEAQVRQRFTIAHEIGHFVLHPKKDAFVDYRDNKKNAMRTPREIHANMFAAALLMPGKPLMADFKKLASNGLVTDDELAVLAEKYKVSEESMRFRLMNLHLLSII